MIINKKFDRLRQWTDERMGAKSKTELSDDFKALEAEINLRHEGMKENQKAMAAYVKNISQRVEDDNKEKQTPICSLGNTMASHGDDFANDSTFGQCLSLYGQSNERLARTQDTFAAKATSTWLESTERSLAQMKEYQAARKKLESRRLAYDTAQTKMEKSKNADNFRIEEELRLQKAKYEESQEDVHQRMLDIREQEAESVQDLSDFLEAQLAYHDRCRDILLQLKREWPASNAATYEHPAPSYTRQMSSSPSPTSLSYEVGRDRFMSNSNPSSRADSLDRFSDSTGRLRGEQTPPTPGSTASFFGPMQPLGRIRSNPTAVQEQKLALRPVPLPRRASEYDSSSETLSPMYTPSPVASLASVTSPGFSGAPRAGNGERRKAPPPPPPSRAKKPPPPPPPSRRVVTSPSYT